MNVEISAYDNDRFTSHDLIANFESSSVRIPASKSEINVDLVKAQSTGHNDQVK